MTCVSKPREEPSPKQQLHRLSSSSSSSMHGKSQMPKRRALCSTTLWKPSYQKNPHTHTHTHTPTRTRLYRLPGKRSLYGLGGMREKKSGTDCARKMATPHWCHVLEGRIPYTIVWHTERALANNNHRVLWIRHTTHALGLRGKGRTEARSPAMVAAVGGINLSKGSKCTRYPWRGLYKISTDGEEQQRDSFSRRWKCQKSV